MGETDKTTKGKAQGQTSAGQAGNTSAEETPTFTKSQVEKIRSDALAEAGRATTAAKDAAKRAEEAEKRLREHEDRRHSEELEAAKDDPDKYREVQRRQTDARARTQWEDDRRKFEQDKTEHQERLTRADAIERKQDAMDVAKQYGVDVEILLDVCSDKAAMEKLAVKLPKAGDSQVQGQTRVTGQVDSGKTTGTTVSGRQISEQEFTERSGTIEGIMALKKAIDAGEITLPKGIKL